MLMKIIVDKPISPAVCKMSFDIQTWPFIAVIDSFVAKNLLKYMIMAMQNKS